MIDYETYCRIRLFHQERGLTSSQIGRELDFHETHVKDAPDFSPRGGSAMR